MTSGDTPSVIYAFFFNKTEHPNPPEKRPRWIAGVRGNYNLIYYYANERDVSETEERFRLLDKIHGFARELFVELPYELYSHISVLHDNVGNMMVNWRGSAWGPNETIYPEFFGIFAGDRVSAFRACFDGNLFHSRMYDGYKSNPDHIIKTLGGSEPDDFGFRLRDNRLTDQDRNERVGLVSKHLMKQGDIYVDRNGEGSKEVLYGFGVDSYTTPHRYYVLPSVRRVRNEYSPYPDNRSAAIDGGGNTKRGCPPHPDNCLIVISGGDDIGKVKCTLCEYIFLPTKLFS